MGMMLRWEYFSETAFDSMEAQIRKNRWQGADSFKKISLTRIFYDQIHSCGYPNKTSFISIDAMRNLSNKKKPTQDHILSPQFVARMIYDNPNVWLSDYEIFKDLFFKCCQTIQVTRQENDILRGFTSSRNDNFSIRVPTVKKYDAAGINLFDGNAFISNKIFEDLVPKELTEYEKQYLTS